MMQSYTKNFIKISYWLKLSTTELLDLGPILKLSAYTPRDLHELKFAILVVVTLF